MLTQSAKHAQDSHSDPPSPGPPVNRVLTVTGRTYVQSVMVVVVVGMVVVITYDRYYGDDYGSDCGMVVIVTMLVVIDSDNHSDGMVGAGGSDGSRGDDRSGDGGE